MQRLLCRLFLLAAVFSGTAPSQSADFLHPQQKGPFQIDGLSYVEFALGGRQSQSGYIDPLNLGSGYSVPTLDQIVDEIKATGANLVKLNLTIGQVKNYTDNAYDPTLPFPLEGTPSNIIAFGQKLAAQGIPCLMAVGSGVENIIAGATLDTSKVNPTDRRAFMTQHIPRLVSSAQIAEGAACEYFAVFGDEIEQLVADPTLTDLWIQAINQIRAVYSGRLTSTSSWGEHGGGFTFDHQPQIINMLDIFGIGLFPAFTDHADPSVAELVASYTNNSSGHNSLLSVDDMHTLYQKPLAVTDEAFGSFKGSNVQSDSVLFGENPASQFSVDDQEQVNLYQAFLQVMPTLDPNWMLGAVFDSFDRLPYAWKDTHLPPYLGSLGESIRDKPAALTLTQAYQASRPVTIPANGWWFSPQTPGALYAVEAENGVVRLGSFVFSAQGGPQWNLARCVQTVPGTYLGTAEQYTGGWALNQSPSSPTAIVDGPAVKLVFQGATTATLQIGTQTVPIQRYQFSDQWASPMLNAPRSGWWDQSTQSGRGYFLEAQGNTLFLGGLIYGSSGQPRWFTSTGPVASTGNFSAKLTVCSAQPNSDGTLQAPTCNATTDTIRLTFSTPWRATLRLDQEPPVDLRRYRQNEIGWAGPAPAFALPNPGFLGQSATVNAASYSSGVAPGSIATIFGTGLTRGVNGVVLASAVPLPYSLQGTSVLVDGIPAPIFGIANINGQEQINFQVPWEIQGQPIPPQLLSPAALVVTANPAASIVVVNNGAVSPALRALYSDVQPAIITSDGTHAIAVRSDYSLVSSLNPARPGEAITLYGVGFGPATPPAATGMPSGGSPPSVINPNPSVSISAQNATTLFAGLSPGAVGLYQFNIVMPNSLGVGDLPGLVRVGGQISNVFSLPVEGQASVQAELIQNGSFENQVLGTWIEYAAVGGAAAFERTTATVYSGDYSEHVSITTAGPFYGVALIQTGIPLAHGTTYQLQFWAKASSIRHMQIATTKDGGDFHLYGLSNTSLLGTDWQLYSAVFQATESSSDARLVFYFGDQIGDVWIDGVSLMPVAAGTP